MNLFSDSDVIGRTSGDIISDIIHFYSETKSRK